MDPHPEGAPLPSLVADMFDRAFRAEKGSTPPIDLIEPLVADLVSTLGWTPEETEQLVQDLGVGAPGEAHDLVAIAEEVQQWLHDGFLDTTWPACPEHKTHPLWLDEATPPRWTCQSANLPVCVLGELGSLVAVDEERARMNRERLAAERKSVADMVDRFRQDREERERT